MEKHQDNSYRYERKFFIPNVNRSFIESLIIHHPSFFSEIYHERYVNNIYLDYADFKNFTDNINGNTERIKYRIRWYDGLFSQIDEPVLELKIKNGLLGTKKSYKLTSFLLNDNFDIEVLKNTIIDSKLESQIQFTTLNQIPTLLNRYRRKYFESADKKFRITIDDCLNFYKIGKYNNNFLNKYSDNSNIILELKYNEKIDSEASTITNILPFRLDKSSKYAKGVEILYC